jgi:exodeoxyribonuclease VII large subunit
VPVVSGIGHETDFTLVDFAADLRAPTPTGAAVLATPDVADLSLSLQRVIDRLAGGMQAILDQQRGQVDALQARLNRASPLWRLRNGRQRLDDLHSRLARAAGAAMALKRARLDVLTARLYGLSPKEVLRHGYALIEKSDGTLVRSAAQLQPQDKIRLRLADGQASATVEQVEQVEEKP